MDKSFLPREFDWDEGNASKSWEKHGVRPNEAEEVFFNEPLFLGRVDNSKIFYREERYLAYGVTQAKRLLFVVFTVRLDKIRVISARDMNKKEREFYYEEKQKTG